MEKDRKTERQKGRKAERQGDMTILCIGDSLTEGDYGIYGKSCIANVKDRNYPYFLSQILNVPVINKGRCGYTATTYWNEYLTWKEKYTDISLIIVMLGTNGGMWIGDDSQGARDYDRLIRKLRSDYPTSKLAVCSAPHVTEDRTKSNYGYAERVRLANAFIKKYVVENEITLIDTASIPEFTAENESVMQPNDGLHFSEKGYQCMASFIAEKIKENHLLEEENSDFIFRVVRPDEAEQTVAIEQCCFPPNEACKPNDMRRRVAAVPELFLVAVDPHTGKLAGFLNGIASTEESFRDDFFKDETLHQADAENVMLLGLDVLPGYRGRGLAHALMERYAKQEKEKGRKKLILTCLQEKIPFYENMGYQLQGVSASVLGGETWYEMIRFL